MPMVIAMMIVMVVMIVRIVSVVMTMVMWVVPIGRIITVKSRVIAVIIGVIVIRVGSESSQSKTANYGTSNPPTIASLSFLAFWGRAVAVRASIAAEVTAISFRLMSAPPFSRFAPCHRNALRH